MVIIAEGCYKQLEVGKFSPEHLESLTKNRGLVEKWVKASGTTLKAEKASELLRYKVYSDGILLQGENGYFQFRPDDPWTDPKTNKKAKYLTPKGIDYDVILPRHPDIENFWNGDIEEIKRHCIKINERYYIILTEGVFKAIAGCMHMLLAIALVGVWMGAKKTKNKVYKKLVDSLERLADLGFGFIFAFDADCVRKPQVMKAQRELGQLLLRKGVPVLTCTGHWSEEDGKGMDDYIQNKGIEEFRKILMNAQNFIEWQKEHFEDGCDELKPKSKTELGEELVEEYKKQWLWCDEYKSWLEHNPETGLWKPKSNEMFEHFLEYALREKGIKPNSHTISEVGKTMRRMKTIEHWNSRSNNIIPFNNGIREINSNKFHEHSPDNRLLWKLPHKYIYKSKPSYPKIDKWLDKVTRGNKHDKAVLITYMAAVLKRKYDLQTFLYIIGPGGSGKSTFTDLLTEMMGEENTAVSKIDNLLDKNQIISLFEKPLLICSEVSASSKKGFEAFKGITGGDLMSGRYLFKDFVSFRFKGLAVLTSNPPFAFPSSNSTALNRRMHLIEFKNVVKTKDQRNLMAEFRPEIPDLIQYLLNLDDEYIRKILKKESTSGAISYQSWSYQMDNDPVTAWLNEEVIYDFDSNNPVKLGTNKDEWLVGDYNPKASTLYGSYCRFCRNTGRSIINPQSFSRKLSDITKNVLGWDKVERKRKRLNKGYPASVFYGLRLRNEDDAKVLTIDETLEQAEESLLNPDAHLCQHTEETSQENQVEVEAQKSDSKGDSPTVSGVSAELMDFDLVDYWLEPLEEKDNQTPETIDNKGISNIENVEEIENKEDPPPCVDDYVDDCVDLSQDKQHTPEQIKQCTPEPKKNPIDEVEIQLPPNLDISGFPCPPDLNREERIERLKEILNIILSAENPDHFEVLRLIGVHTDEEINWVWNNACSPEDKERIHKLISSQKKKIPEEKPPQVKPKTTTSNTKNDEIDYSTFPHLTSDDIRAKKNFADKIKQMLMDSKTVNDLEAVKSLYGEKRRSWVIDNMLSLSEKEYIEDIYVPPQQNLDI